METREEVRMYSNKEDRSFGSLFAELTQETATLVQQEVALAKAEMSEKISQVGSGLATLIIGGFVLFAGLLKLLDAVIFGIAELLPPDLTPWLAALIVGGIVAIIGAVMLQKGRSNLKSTNLAPQRTAESLRRDKDFVKEQVG
jgi:Putative Actinobacterial Holin-X, holin superfamily III